MSREEYDREYVQKLVDLNPKDWNPVLILAAQSFLRRAYLENTK